MSACDIKAVVPTGGQLGHFALGSQTVGAPQAVEEAPKLERYCLPTFNCQLFTISNHIYV